MATPAETTTPAPATPATPADSIMAGLIALDANIRANGHEGPVGSGLHGILETLAGSSLGIARKGFPKPTPAPKPAPYPVLEAFKGRKAEQYLDPTRLGAIRDQKEASR